MSKIIYGEVGSNKNLKAQINISMYSRGSICFTKAVLSVKESYSDTLKKNDVGVGIFLRS